MAGEFKNVVLCEDIRDEIGNKKSLIGVMSGDIIVSAFPAQIRIAFYAEYVPKKDSAEHSIQFNIIIDADIVATGEATIAKNNEVSVFVIPQALVMFEKESEIILKLGSDNDLSEVLRKKVFLPTVAGGVI